MKCRATNEEMGEIGPGHRRQVRAVYREAGVKDGLCIGETGEIAMDIIRARDYPRIEDATSNFWFFTIESLGFAVPLWRNQLVEPSALVPFQDNLGRQSS